MTLAQFRGTLDKMAWISFPRDIRGEITMSRLREREVDSRVIVSDAEVDNLLQQQKASRGGAGIQPVARAGAGAGKCLADQIQENAPRRKKRWPSWKRAPSLRRLPRLFRCAGCPAGRALAGPERADSGRVSGTAGKARCRSAPGVIRSANGFHILQLNEKRSKWAASSCSRPMPDTS